jgi:gluconolactonase
MAIEQLSSGLAQIVRSDAEIGLLAEGFASAEGPVWFAERQRLVFSEVGIAPHPTGFRRVNDGRRLSVDSLGEVLLEQDGTNLTNGMTRDSQGRLISCESGSKQVTRLEPDGSTTVLATRYRGARFSSPNDVVVKSDGSIYFTDTGGVQAGGDLPYSAVFRISADLAHVDLLAHEFQLVNGLAFSPDEQILYVNDSQGLRAENDTFYSQGTIRAYDVRTSGLLANSRLFAELRGDRSGMPDGIKVDVRGNVFCTGPGGVWVFDPSGDHLGTILTDVIHNHNDPTNMAFGGPDGKTLFITTSSSVLSIQLEINGLPPPA